jgi:hypothetical protein
MKLTRFAIALALGAANVMAASTAVTLAGSPNPSTFGQRVTLTAAISPSSATGSVTFYDGTVILGSARISSGQANLTTILLGPGLRSLTAFYTGDASNASSTSPVLLQKVNPVPANAFLPAVNYHSDTSPFSIAMADFNGDGVADLAVTNINGGSGGNISVFIGNGDGTFQPAVLYRSNPYPFQVLAVDINGDGELDLIAGIASGSSSVNILLGNGDGTFQPAVSYAIGSEPMAVADFNGDGKADLVVSLKGAISVMLGNGDGTFQPGLQFPIAPGPLAVGDFNGDGKPDLAVANSNANQTIVTTVSVLLGNGDGTFQPARTFPDGDSPNFMVAGDFNGDGKADLAVANSPDNQVGILLGNGDGTFRPVVKYAAGEAPISLAAGDFNGDGNLDLVTTSYYGSNVSILLNNGDGTFQLPLDYGVGIAPAFVVVADFNGDGRPDLAVANHNSNDMSVLLGASLPTVSTTLLTSTPNPSAYRQSTTLTATISPADATGTVKFYDGPVSLGSASIAKGQATLTTAFLTTGPHSIGASYGGDATHPASLFPLLTLNINPAQPVVTLSSSASPAQPGQTVFLTATVSPADADGMVTFYDGATVLSTRPLVNGQAGLTAAFTAGAHSLTVFYGGSVNYVATTSPVLNQTVTASLSPSTVTLVSPANPSPYGQPLTLAASVAPNSATGKVTFYDGTTVLGTAALANGQATFTTNLLATGARSLKAHYSGDTNVAPGTSTVLSQQVGATPVAANGFRTALQSIAGSGPDSIVTADFNGDGRADLAVANHYDGTVSVLLGNGDGTFSAPVNYTTGETPLSVAVGDLNADGKPDLAVVNEIGSVSVLLGNGDGTFQTAVNYTTGFALLALQVAIADFNLDGKADLAVVNGQNNVAILPGNGDGTFQTPLLAALGLIPTNLLVADFDGDGKPDLVIGSGRTGLVSLLLGIGDGTFRVPLTIGPGFPMSVADFNRDGKPDLVIGDPTGSIGVLPGNGDGTFGPAAKYPAGAGSAAVVDFNADGKPDLLIADLNNLSVLLGNGDGTFQPARILGPAQSPAAIAVGDFNGDGRPDVAITNSVGQNLSVLLGATLVPSTITLQSAPNPSVYGQPVALTAQVSPANATGIVTFYDGTTILGTSNIVSGRSSVNAAFQSAGTHSLTAVYSGDDANLSATSALLLQTVNQAPTTILLSSSSNPATPGQTIVLTATVSPASAAGSVTFYDVATPVGMMPLVNGQAALTVSFPDARLHLLTAFYPGTANYASSISEVVTQIVTAPRLTPPSPPAPD